MKGRIFAVIIAMLFGFTGIENASAADGSASSTASAYHKDKGHRGKHNVRHHHRHGRVKKAHAYQHHHAKYHKAKRAHRHHHGHKHQAVRRCNHR